MIVWEGRAVWANNTKPAHWIDTKQVEGGVQIEITSLSPRANLTTDQARKLADHLMELADRIDAAKADA